MRAGLFSTTILTSSQVQASSQGSAPGADLDLLVHKVSVRLNTDIIPQSKLNVSKKYV